MHIAWNVDYRVKALNTLYYFFISYFIPYFVDLAVLILSSGLSLLKGTILTTHTCYKFGPCYSR